MLSDCSKSEAAITMRLASAAWESSSLDCCVAMRFSLFAENAKNQLESNAKNTTPLMSIAARDTKATKLEILVGKNAECRRCRALSSTGLNNNRDMVMYTASDPARRAKAAVKRTTKVATFRRSCSALSPSSSSHVTTSSDRKSDNQVGRAVLAYSSTAYALDRVVGGPKSSSLAFLGWRKSCRTGRVRRVDKHDTLVTARPSNISVSTFARYLYTQASATALCIAQSGGCPMASGGSTLVSCQSPYTNQTTAIAALARCTALAVGGHALRFPSRRVAAAAAIQVTAIHRMASFGACAANASSGRVASTALNRPSGNGSATDRFRFMKDLY